MVAARRWQNLGDRDREAAARYEAGWISYRLRGDAAAAAYAAKRATALFQEAGDESMAAHSMLLAASALVEMPSSAKRRYQSLIRLSRSCSRDIRSQSRCVRNGRSNAPAGIDQIRSRQFRAPLSSCSTDRRDEARQLHEPAGVHKALANAAHMLYQLGRFREAVALYDQILAADASRSDRGMYDEHVDNSAQPRTVIGEFESALLQYQESLELHALACDVAGQSRSLSGIGVAYQRIGNPSRAVEYLKQAINLQGAVGIRQGADLRSYRDRRRLS